LASPAVKHAAFQAREFSITPNFRSLAELASSLGQAPVYCSTGADRSGVSTLAGLKGVKAAMVAIGLEAAAVVVVYGVWQAWHIVR
jgi:hypothetical protein